MNEQTTNLSTNQTEVLSITGSTQEQKEVRKMFMASLNAAWRVLAVLDCLAEDFKKIDGNITKYEILNEAGEEAAGVLHNLVQVIPEKIGIDININKDDPDDYFTVAYKDAVNNDEYHA